MATVSRVSCNVYYHQQCFAPYYRADTFWQATARLQNAFGPSMNQRRGLNECETWYSHAFPTFVSLVFLNPDQYSYVWTVTYGLHTSKPDSAPSPGQGCSTLWLRIERSAKRGAGAPLIATCHPLRTSGRTLKLEIIRTVTPPPSIRASFPPSLRKVCFSSMSG